MNPVNHLFCFFFIKECFTGFHFFEKVQDLPTRGAVAVQHFTINGSLFLTFGKYHGDIHKYNISSIVYKMDKLTEKFTLYQTLQTRGVFGLEYFSITDKLWLITGVVRPNLTL